jgi:tetratricopeptide (TPR) repeat protein
MTRLFYLLLVALPVAAAILPVEALGQDIHSLLRQGAQLEAAFKEEEALSKYKEVLRVQPDNIPALCECSDLSCRIGNRQASREKKVSYFQDGMAYAKAAYRLAPHSGDVNIVMAFSTARMALIQSAREKVAAAADIKKYAENAIREDPANFKGYHILGRWHYEVSNLNAIERTLAKWFYGALPEASLPESIGYFEKSMSLAPYFMLNYLELAKACRRDGQKDRAITLLRHMETLPDKMLDDSRVRQEGKKLLEDLE